jgi:hypothetical protein
VKQLLILLVTALCPLALQAEDLERLRYNNPGLVVDLGVGLWAWPLPVDYDQDGDLDLLVSCPDKPANGIYFFENPDGNVKQPIFLPGKRIAPGQRNITISHLPGGPRILVPGREFTGWRENRFTDLTPVYPGTNLLSRDRKIRTNQWSLVDLDGDDVLEMVVGVGEWTDYGWDDAYDSQGTWTNGPLHGWVYVIRAGREAGSWQQPELLKAGGMPIDVFGKPAPNFADFDGDGDLDLVCGEFLDKFTYFENTGTRQHPVYAAGRRLLWRGRPLAMQLQMIVPSAIDWDHDGDVDLIVGDEDGRVALVEHSGRVVDGLPRFLPPVYFQQQADEVKFGALATPVGFDWDADGDDDILCGNTAGQVAWIENLSGAGQFPPRWAAPRLLEAAGTPIQIMAGPNGSIQGPCEAKWGYTTLTAGDWDHDGRADLVVNSIWGRVTWYRNIGSPRRPRLAAAQPLEVLWPGETPRPAWNWWKPEGKELVTQWRTTPVMVDFNADGLNDLVMLDHEGYLCLWPRTRSFSGDLALLPPERIFVDPDGKPIQLNAGRAGRSGRRKLAVSDWDGDGDLDLLVNSSNADLLENIGQKDGTYVLVNRGPLGQRPIAGHTSSPTLIDLDSNQVPDLLVGAEDGFLYYLKNPRVTTGGGTSGR